MVCKITYVPLAIFDNDVQGAQSLEHIQKHNTGVNCGRSLEWNTN